jgi:hypothetical protein
MDTPQTDDRTTTPPHGPSAPLGPDDDDRTQGISNRETSAQEELERKEHPPLADEEPQSQPHRAPSANQ